MKVVCRPDELLTAFQSPFVDMGFEWSLWHGKKSEFDMFDEEKPHLVIANTHDLTPAFIKCLNENKHVECILFDKDKYRHDTNALEYDYYIMSKRNLSDESTNIDVDMGISLLSIMQKVSAIPHVDTTTFYPYDYSDEMACDVGVYGEQNDFIYSLCYPINAIHIKIFGPHEWTQPQYMGLLSHKERLSLYKSASVCWANDVQEALKIAACGGFPISNQQFIVDIFFEECLVNNVKDIKKKISLSNEILRNKCYDIVVNKYSSQSVVEKLLGAL